MDKNSRYGDLFEESPKERAMKYIRSTYSTQLEDLMKRIRISFETQHEHYGVAAFEDTYASAYNYIHQELDKNLGEKAVREREMQKEYQKMAQESKAKEIEKGKAARALYEEVTGRKI